MPGRLSAGVILLCLITLLVPSLCAQTKSTNSTIPGSPTNSIASTNHDTNTPSATVVIVENSDATRDLLPVQDVVQTMLERALTNLTGKATAADAWRSIITTNDVVGLKVYSSPGPDSGTRPTVVAAIITSLLAAGLPTNHIVVWDQRSVELRLAGYFEFEKRFGVQVAGAMDEGYDQRTFYDTPFLGPMNSTDVDFTRGGPGFGRKSYVSKLLTGRVTKIINVTPLLPHNSLGVTGNLYSLAIGGVDNTLRFENSPYELARAVPEIIALPIMGDRVALNVVDALICQYEGQSTPLLHYSTVLNQLRVSRDPVALDTLSLAEIIHQCQLAGVPAPKTNQDLLVNASLLEIGVSDPKQITVRKLQ
jgi:hypothetical protein